MLFWICPKGRHRPGKQSGHAGLQSGRQVSDLRLVANWEKRLEKRSSLVWLERYETTGRVTVVFVGSHTSVFTKFLITHPEKASQNSPKESKTPGVRGLKPVGLSLTNMWIPATSHRSRLKWWWIYFPFIFPKRCLVERLIFLVVFCKLSFSPSIFFWEGIISWKVFFFLVLAEGP